MLSLPSLAGIGLHGVTFTRLSQEQSVVIMGQGLKDCCR